MAGSIGDWYANASAREHGGHGHDWENDDLVDRTRDSWLDDRYGRRSARAEAAPRGRSQSGRPGRESVEVARAARRILAGEPNLRIVTLVARLSGRFRLLDAGALRRALGTVHQKDLAVAARGVLGAKAGADVATVANHLRARGWPTVTPGDVRAALDADRTVEPLTRAVWALDAETPGRGALTVARELRRLGFPAATAGDVGRARRAPVPRADAAVTVKVGPRRRPTPVSAPRKSDAADVVPALDPALAAVAARVILAMAPQIGVRTLVSRLRACGWSGLAEAEAERIAAGIRGEAPGGKPLAPVTRSAAATAVAVRAFHTMNYGSSTKILKRLQQWGWNSVTLDEVRRVQVRLPAWSSPSRPASGEKPVRVVLSPPRQAPANMMGPHRTLDITERPNARTCHGCGRAISSLGFCGCS